MGKLTGLLKKTIRILFKAFGKVVRIFIFIRFSGNKAPLNKVRLDLKTTLKKASVTTDTLWLVNIKNSDAILSFNSIFDFSSIIILTKNEKIESTKKACYKAGFSNSNLDLFITDYKENNDNNFQKNPDAKPFMIDIASSMISTHHIVGLDAITSNPEKALKLYHFILKADIIMIAFRIYDLNFDAKLQKTNKFFVENDFKLLKINRSNSFIRKGVLTFIFIKENSPVDNLLFKLPAHQNY